MNLFQAVPSPQVPGFDPNARGRNEGVAVLLAGHPGTWKTSWAAQWPGVAFLSIQAERGDTAIDEYPSVVARMFERSNFVGPDGNPVPPAFNVNVPAVFKIKSVREFRETLSMICKRHRELGIFTVVIDSVSYLIDLWQHEILHARYADPSWRAKFDAGEEVITQRDWGSLNNYLMNMRMLLNRESLNAIYIAHVEDKFSVAPNGDRTLQETRLMISGKNQIKLPGSCDIHIYADRRWEADRNAIGRQVLLPTYWTSSNPKVQWVRHRFGNKFPKGRLVDPEWDNFPTFRAIWWELHEHIYIGQR